MVLGRTRGRLFPGILAAAFAGTAAVSVVLTAVLLDSFLIRYDRGSVTTMLPGFVYAIALILKTSLVEAAVLGAFAFVTMASGRPSEAQSKVPSWTIFSVLLPAAAPLLGTLVILVTQAIVDKPDADTVSYFTRISRTGVFTLIGILVAAIASAIVALVRRERPWGLPLIALATSIFVLVLFQYWEFYKLGFDQDRWNAI